MTLLRAGQVDLEGRALAHFAVHLDVPAALFDDAKDGGQPQPGALSLLLGGEEGLKDASLDPIVHAHARITDGQQHVLAGLGLHVQGGVGLVENHVGRLDGQGASSRHGIASIDRQVGDHLVDLRRVGLDRPQVVGQRGHQSNVFADDAPQHAAQVTDHLIEAQYAGSDHLPPAESDQLPGQPGGSVDGLAGSAVRARAGDRRHAASARAVGH